MTKRNSQHPRIALATLAILLIPATIFARQTAVATAPPAHISPRIHSRTSAHPAEAKDATTYNYTLVSYPGTLSTYGVGLNPDAIHWGGETTVVVVGAEVFPDGSSQTGFGAVVSEGNSDTELYELLNDPAAPTPQQAYSVNDYGIVVGDYIDAAGIFHSYIYEAGQFKKFDVPFAGATGTYSPAINNAGEIVGAWNDSAGNEHNYTLIAGKFVSFDVPGAAEGQFYYGINSQGEITGSYADADGNVHGFLRKGNSYTRINFPGALYTAPTGINDAGVIVGGYCLTTECLATGEGEMGFMLTNGVFTTISIPGEPIQALESINNDGVLMGNYLDAAGLIYTFLAVPSK